MGEAAERLTRLVESDDRYNIPFEDLRDAQVEVFVRDRGRGFDEAAVPEDRLGVRNSIVDRMRRHGGTAVIRTAPGDGTEVRLAMAPSTAANASGTRTEENAS